MPRNITIGHYKTNRDDRCSVFMANVLDSDIIARKFKLHNHSQTNLDKEIINQYGP